MQCCYNAVKFLENLHKKTLHSSPVRASYGVSFVNTYSDLCNTALNEVLYKISHYIGLHYNSTILYLHLQSFLNPETSELDKIIPHGFVCLIYWQVNNELQIWANDLVNACPLCCWFGTKISEALKINSLALGRCCSDRDYVNFKQNTEIDNWVLK